MYGGRAGPGRRDQGTCAQPPQSALTDVLFEKLGYLSVDAGSLRDQDSKVCGLPNPCPVAEHEP